MQTPIQRPSNQVIGCPERWHAVPYSGESIHEHDRRASVVRQGRVAARWSGRCTPCVGGAAVELEAAPSDLPSSGCRSAPSAFASNAAATSPALPAVPPSASALTEVHNVSYNALLDLQLHLLRPVVKLRTMHHLAFRLIWWLWSVGFPFAAGVRNAFKYFPDLLLHLQEN